MMLERLTTIRYAARSAVPAAVFLAAVVAPADTAADGKFSAAQLDAFSKRVAARHGLEQADVLRLVGDARFQPRIVELMDRPAETKPWAEYREIFVTPNRIAGGVDFWATHAQTLARARSRFGVPEEIIVAIIGVETRYGVNMGSYRVLDALATLAFGYPRRADYFSTELETFVVLARDTGLDALRVEGSYAGAIGVPQFMPSSYRNYAVDFDADGKTDLAGSEADAIGSVGNYLVKHGWAPGAPVVKRVGAGEASRAGVVRLDARGGTEYWQSFTNFAVIKRYNNSSFYAMAVAQLASEIRERRFAALRAELQRSGQPTSR